MGGQRYTQQQCFIKALEIDDQHADAWNFLGYNCGGGIVGGQQHTRQQCHAKHYELRVAA